MTFVTIRLTATFNLGSITGQMILNSKFYVNHPEVLNKTSVKIVSV